ncbi:flagellin [Bacillus sp. AFS015802]|uniref:flagellin N-terminal helical domain-containing protein n=1 Tax=Bacillus sp. AFS015802 TaxID=2033486 RepID=UPI000BF7F8BE|nr:flagellin [Bacillus sp. AFS015802]PFA67365.1 flagellin [Bacillus sp. AFS015802]
MRINHNIAALNTYRQLNSASGAQSKSMEKLSSGLRINRAGDDAAGLAISEKMRGQIRGLDQAARNAQDGISMIQTAEGALNETHSILQRMRELSVQSSNDTNTLDDRKEIQKEVEQLKSEINRISDTTEFNTQKLLNGSLGAQGTSADTSVVNVDSATGLKKGTYNVTVDTAATKASAAAGSTDFSTPGDVSGKDLSINGVTIDFSGMTSADTAAIVAKINEYSDETGVVASVSTNNVKLDQANFGSNYDINLAGTDAAEFGQAITAGADAVATISNPDGLSQTVTGVGQSVSYGGGEFTATAATNGLSTTFDVTSSGASFQIGANKDQNMLIDMNEMSTSTLGNSTDGLVKDINLLTQEGANDAIKTLDAAISEVSGERSKLGAFQNRLEHTINNLGTSSENLTASESRIRDVDYALAA